ncbi:MAG: hypothetical protein IJZ57_00275 [Clostridia bacterium]|nr:hypothetical protein [Clostridia bacterium]
MTVDSLKNALRDKKTWEEILKEQDTIFLSEIEAAKRNKNFNHYDFEKFIQFLESKEKTECYKEHSDKNSGMQF